MTTPTWALLGFGPFAYGVLERSLLEGWAPACVLTMPGRSDLELRDLSVLANRFGVPVSEEDPNREGIEVLRDLSPDVLFTVNYPWILSEQLLALARVALNIHGSLLPVLRGRAPLTWSIINGMKETGVTVHLMEAAVDTGPIVMQRAIPITERDTVETIQRQMLAAYPEMVKEALIGAGEGHLVPTPQSGSATYGVRRRPEDGQIDWRWTGERIFNWVRALTRPYPGAFTSVGDSIVRVWATTSVALDVDKPPGHILGRAHTVGVGAGYAVACSDGIVVLLDFDDHDGVLGSGVVLG